MCNGIGRKTVYRIEHKQAEIYICWTLHEYFFAGDNNQHSFAKNDSRTTENLRSWHLIWFLRHNFVKYYLEFNSESFKSEEISISFDDNYQ